MFTKSLSIILTAIVLSSCSKAKEPKAPEGKVALQLSTVVSRSDNTMPDGSKLGVYIDELSNEITPPDFKIENIEYTSNETSLTSSTPTYLELGKSFDIYSYSPYRTTISNPEAIEFTHNEDLLWAPKATITNVTETNHSANLYFVHKTSQIKFNVVVDPNFDSDDDSFPDNTELTSLSSIKITGFAPTATLNITDGSVTLGSGASPEMAAKSTEIANNPGKYALTTDMVCFFIPFNGEAKELTIEVTHAGITMTGTISRAWVAGESYTYTVTATKNSTIAILGMSATIDDWVEKRGDLIVQ